VFWRRIAEGERAGGEDRLQGRRSGIGGWEIVTLQRTRPFSVYGERSFKNGFVKT